MGLIGMMLTFYAMSKMNLGDAAMLLNTFPLFVVLFAPFFLKESSNPRVFFLVLVAFVGIAFILKPTREIINTASLAGLAGGVAVAFAMISVRKLHATDSTWTIATWFSAVIAIGALPMTLMNFIMPTMEEWLILVLSGTILTASQLFLTKAYRYAKASIIAPFGYLSVIWSYGFDVIVWKQMPDVWSAIGSAIIIGSGIGIMELARRPVIKPGATT
jgi:drug/metabolite transporter (DMT)-like permease